MSRLLSFEECMNRAKRMDAGDKLDFIKMGTGIEQEELSSDMQALEKSLGAYTRAAWPIIEPGQKYISNWHLDCMYEYLEAVTLGQVKRLIINVPRRTSKSTSVAVMWPTWSWLKKPSSRWMFSSYSSKLGIKSANDRRLILQSNWFQDRWSERVKLSSHRFAVEEFHNTARGRMMTTSVGGSTTGSGGDILVADDLLSIDDSYSDAMRNRANQYYDQTFSTSADQWKECAIVIIMQRVHEDDLTGHVTKVKEEGWVTLSFPMEAETREVTHFPLSGKTYIREPGDPLWEERFPKGMFPATKQRLGSYGWASQYQQRPSPLGGGLFHRSWWKFYDKLPDKFDHLFFSIDCAFKDKNTSDYVAGIVLGQVGANYYLMPIAIHDRLSFGRTKEAIKLLSEKFPTAREKLVEDKANGTAIIDDLRATVPGLIPVEPHGGKMARASVASPFVEAGNVLLPGVQQFLINAADDGKVQIVPSAWTDGFIEEHAVFPNGANDDWVDTLSQAIIRATQGRPGFLEFMRMESEAAIEKKRLEKEAADARKNVVVQKGNMMINGPNAFIRRHQP